jgi:endonuclease/exonuclease/phosphatase family metal-dependent hydrolase
MAAGFPPRLLVASERTPMIPARLFAPTLVWYTGFVIGLLTPLPASAVKLMNYNILNYPGASGAAREDEFRTIMTAVHPDILIVQEMTGTTSAGQTQFLNNVLNSVFPGEYAAATPWINGPDTNNALFYRTAAFTLISVDTLDTELRAIHEYVVRPVGYTAAAANLRIYSMHLKAGSTTDDKDQRLREASVLRNYANVTFNSSTHFIYAGDFNIQSSSETSYQRFIGSEADNDGRAFDPINTPGSWNNNSTFAAIHTQSPKTASNPYGGATGGMDDRFDFQLISSALQDAEGLSYVSGTYKCYGNDGQHFNLAIDALPVIPEGAEMAAALEEASDHMPVVMDLQVPAKVTVVASLNFGTVIVGGTASQNLAVSNGATAPADELNYTLAAPAGFSAPGGGFVANAGAGANNHLISMNTGTAGNKNGNLSVNSDDVDFPAKTVALSGTVLNHANPSVTASPVALADTADFGSQPVGGFVDIDISLFNSGYGSLQALLDVYSAAITGPDAARFSIVGGFSPANVGASPAEYSLRFDDTGAAANTTYTATLTFSTRDQQDLSGAVNLPDLTWHLTAHVSGQTGVPGDGVLPTVTRLVGNYPNPFQRTSIAFDLAEAESVRLEIFDVHGRLVTRLFKGALDRGHYTLAWDGTDDRGTPAGAGIYFYRLETGRYTATKTMTLLR